LNKKRRTAIKKNLILQPFNNFSFKEYLSDNCNLSIFNYMTFALAATELGVSSSTINLVLLTSVVVLLGLPTFFLFKSAQGKSAF